MTCTNSPVTSSGASRASLFDRLGFGNVWDWLRDLLNGVFFRSDLYDTKNNPYLSMNREYIPSLPIVDDTDADKATVTNFSGTEPDNQQPQDDPGIVMWPAAYNEYTYNATSRAWEFKESHQELIIRAVINGVTRYGRIPMFATYPTEGVVVGISDLNGTTPVYTLTPPTWDAGTPQNTVNQLTAQVSGVLADLQIALSRLQQEGVLRGWIESITTPF